MQTGTAILYRDNSPQPVPTLVNAAVSRVARLSGALHVDVNAATRLLLRLTEHWGRRPLEPCVWPSEIGDDHSACELSVAFADTPELRIMVEPLGDRPSLVSNREAAWVLLRSLAADPELDVDLSRLESISDLFLPAEPHGRFAIWVAAGLRPGSAAPDIKVYLNPEARGPGWGLATVEECLTRLGFGRAWETVARVLVARGPVLDRLMYVSLDLSPRADARLKIYARHQHATRDDLERAAAPAAASRPGDVRAFLDLAVPGETVLEGRAPFTCWSFVAGDHEPATATTHVPINSYALNDEVRARALAVFSGFGQDTGPYEDALAALADRPLSDRIGMQSYLSFRRDTRGARVTVYLPLELHRAGVVAQPSFVPEPQDALTIVQRFEELEPITIHPMLRRLAREPVNRRSLYLVLANFQISVSLSFARHLAGITARVQDERVRSILAHQLDDELGNGDPDRAHVRLFAAMMERLSPWRPAQMDDGVWVPGRRFDRHLREAYEAQDAWEAVGAVMVGEVYGKQIDLFLGEQLRRQGEIDAESLSWLVLHEQLEVEHAEDSAQLAGIVPPEAVPAIWRGAQRAGRAGRAFLDDLYTVCYLQ